ncbi:DUF1707 and DUF2154 domain-containing protein [Actinospica durhamensis]|uniref:DUF1707 and DUF2154 domain-containing protein n=1 Tax=Actinospica durhamensis TaxID=1508375 RepID=A0A941ISU8_9ACTN|nr:DUF1707 domain-containing protein [Actinospica durhamensis]MBR7835288.1 DUF1707 and DUF2154 domain-containing protein [Actinospica durhamensis]
MTPPLSFGTEPAPSDDRRLSLRASDADRDHVAKLLGQAFAEGRLSADEHAERTETAYAAKTLGELRPLLADLPVAFSPPSAATGPGVRGDVPLAATPATDSVVAVFGEQRRRGRWLVRDGMEARAIFGTVELDLTEAVLEQRELTITAHSFFGQVMLRVPEGVMVIDEGTAILGDRDFKLENGAYTAETPIVHVRGFSVFGSVEAKRPRKKWLKKR